MTPLPESRDASPSTQISFLGVPSSRLSAVAVTGSRSGAHSGRLLPYSQNDGASFVPAKPFIAGETVTVGGILAAATGPRPLAFSFTVATPDTLGEAGGSSAPPASPQDHQTFRSRPDLKPPLVTVTAHAAGTSPGELLLAPYSGPGQYGPMILGEDGSMVWFEPLQPSGARAADLRVQAYQGRDVLTWWQDPLITADSRKAGVVIADSAYDVVKVVRAGNGYQADLHEFQITPAGTALITVYDGIRCDLSSLGGPSEGAVADTLMQLLDVQTGLVEYEWHSLDHVPLSDSYVSPLPGSLKEPFDFFHINSIEEQRDGSLLIGARNTWAAYDVDARSGQVLWQLGGRRSSFKLGAGTGTAYQHDARSGPAGGITFFDNGATPRAHSQSRAIEITLDATNMTAVLARRVVHSPPLLAGSQGNVQTLADGNWLVGWGQAPYFSEYGPAGQLLFDAHLPRAYESYRTYRQPWSGRPATRPAFAYVESGGHAAVYASWNGATEVSSWRVLAGRSARALTRVASAPRHGFETRLALAAAPAHGDYVTVQALSAAGAVLGEAIPRRT
ncbi:MAG: arylsulfotransferase family protein [Solirubrobacteraceae bacterium]